MKAIGLILLFVSTVAAGVFLAGCDIDSTSQSVTITPSTTTIKMGQQRTFRASGGYDYIWSLKEEGWGSLSTLAGPETTYTSLYDPVGSNNVATQTLTVNSAIRDNSRATTNGYVYAESATATIKHIPEALILP